MRCRGYRREAGGRRRWVRCWRDWCCSWASALSPTFSCGWRRFISSRDCWGFSFKFAKFRLGRERAGAFGLHYATAQRNFSETANREMHMEKFPLIIRIKKGKDGSGALSCERGDGSIVYQRQNAK